MEENIKKDQHFWHFFTASLYGLLLFILLIVISLKGRTPRSIPVFDFFILTLATFRITRLLVHDLVLDFIRDKFEGATKGLGLSMHDLLDCPWCTGAWVALLLGFLYFVFPITWPFILVMAVAGFGTLLTILASLMMVKLNGK